MDKLSFDFEKNSAELSISKDIYLRILDKGLIQTKGDLPNLDKSIEAGDFDEIKQIAHRIKGDYYNMRIDQISALAKQIEDIAKTSMDKEALKKMNTDLKDLFQQLIEAANSQKQ